MTYVAATWDGAGTDVPLFLLCTSCAMSYIFGDPPVGATVKTIENMSFKSDTIVPVSFVSRTMSLKDSKGDTV